MNSISLKIYPKFAIVFIAVFLLVSIPAPKAQAFEPISISLIAAALAPIVIPYIVKAIPYMWKGFVNMAGAMWDAGAEFARTGYLIMGFFECTVGAPFGLFEPGLSNLYDGMIAPFKGALYACLIPLRTVGLFND
jgi:hypothetical protein